MTSNDYSIEINRWVLKSIGAWPVTNFASKSEKFLSFFLSLVCSFLIGGVLLSCALNTLFEEKDPDMKLKTLGPITFWTAAALKYCLLLMNGRNIRGCIEHMRSDWIKHQNELDRLIMFNSAKTGRYIASFCAVFTHTSVFGYTIIIPITAKLANSGDFNETMKILPYPFYNKIIDARSSPSYELVYMFQSLSVFAVNSVTIGACSLAAVFVMHVKGQLRVLMAWIEKLVVHSTMEKAEQENYKVSIIVVHHLRILSFITNIEEIMHKICLIEMVACTLNICFIGYYLISEWENNELRNLVSYITLFITITFNIFIFNYIGEKLIEECLLVGDTAYRSEWYLLEGKAALDFIMIIAISNRQIKLTAGKLFKLSIATFGNVIKTSFTYLNILRRVTM